MTLRLVSFLCEALSREVGRELLNANQVTLWAGRHRLGGKCLPEMLRGQLSMIPWRADGT